MKLNVVLEFVDAMQSRLTDMDEKLDALGDAVGAMHADVKRLVGRPVLELYQVGSRRVGCSFETTWSARMVRLECKVLCPDLMTPLHATPPLRTGPIRR